MSSARSVAHLFDLLAYQDRQWHEMMQQLEDVFRAHTELNKAVNVLLGDVAQRMPKSTTAAAITAKIEQLDEKLDGMASQIAKNLPEAWHSQMTKTLNELMDQVESGMQNLNRQLADGAGSSTGQATTPMASDMLVQTRDKSKETLARVELLDKNLEKLHAMVQGMAKVLEQPGAAKLFSDIAKPLLERLEQLTRAKMQSIGEDVNLLRGQASGNQKDLCGLIRGLDHSFQQLKAVSDGLALNMAQVGAAFSKSPVDSAGQSRALDLLLQLGESFRDCEGIWQELKESSRDTLTRTQELGTAMAELRDRFSDRQGGQQQGHVMQGFGQQSGPSRMPTVIDLQSRSPQRSQGFATVTFPDGSIKMVSADSFH